MTPTAFAGVDVGASGIRVRAQMGPRIAGDAIAATIPRDEGGIALAELASLIAVPLRVAAGKLGAFRFSTLAVGMAGMPGLVGDPRLLSAALRSAVQIGTIIVAADSVTTHVGALGFEPGVVVAAGTGVVALGTDFAAHWSQVDGLGILLGDEGGGAWIGMAGLKAALRASDGRPGGSPTLLRRMLDTIGDPMSVLARVYARPQPALVLAGFAPEVALAAREGDSTALAIWADAGRRLAQTAAAAATEVEPVFSWGGGVFAASDLILEPFQKEVRRLVPAARFLPPRGSSVDGALSLSQRRVTSKLPFLELIEA